MVEGTGSTAAGPRERDDGVLVAGGVACVSIGFLLAGLGLPIANQRLLGLGGLAAGILGLVVLVLRRVGRSGAAAWVMVWGAGIVASGAALLRPTARTIFLIAVILSVVLFLGHVLLGRRHARWLLGLIGVAVAALGLRTWSLGVLDGESVLLHCAVVAGAIGGQHRLLGLALDGIHGHRSAGERLGRQVRDAEAILAWAELPGKERPVEGAVAVAADIVVRLDELVAGFRNGADAAGAIVLRSEGVLQAQRGAIAVQLKALEGIGRRLTAIDREFHKVYANADSVRNAIDASARANRETRAVSEKWFQHAVELERLLGATAAQARAAEILAVNATVAGIREAGDDSGFSLVAADTQALAERMQQAVTRIVGLIERIRVASQQAVAATEHSELAGAEAVSQATAVRTVIEDQRTRVRRADDWVRDLTSMARELRRDAELVGRSVGRLRDQANRLRAAAEDS
ncbi:MAG: hypothetical protein AAGA56_06470 [Myxococcota bacterium]